MINGYQLNILKTIDRIGMVYVFLAYLNETDKILIGRIYQKVKLWYINQISLIRHWLIGLIYKNVVEFLYKKKLKKCCYLFVFA